jgi:hypothetical protein
VKNKTGRQNVRQSKHSCEFLGFCNNAAEISILLGCDTVPHPGKMRPQLVSHKKVKEAAAESLVIVLVSLVVMLWAWTAQLV